MKTMTELLGSHPFFAGLSPSAVELIAGCASNVHFAEGDRIFDEGKPANIFYVIRHGTYPGGVFPHEGASGHRHHEQKEQVLGWSWLVPPYRYFADARAVAPVSATAVDGACLRGKCEANAELGYQLLKRVATVMYHRMQSARIRMLDLYG